MKIRTESLLIDAVDSELIWRRKELTQFKFLLNSSRHRVDQHTAILRGAVTILYAHWEGFVKNSGQAYVEFVASLKLQYKLLAPPFLALATRGLLNAATGSRKIQAHIDVAKFYLAGLGAESWIPYKNAIDAESNLSSVVLRDVISCLGLDYSPFETKAHLIDERLVKCRNEIAHGDFLLVTLERYEELSEEVDGMMDAFRTQIQNAAVLRQYLAIP